MTSIQSVNNLQKFLGRTLLVSFFVVALLSILMLFIFNFQHEKDSEKWASQRLKNSITIFQSNLSEKLSIVANSTIFIDFLRSGKTSRENLLADLRYELSNAHLNNIKSMSIMSKNNEMLFHYGQKTPYYVTVSLCYLGRSLNNFGECNFYWTLYFIKDEVIAGLKNLRTDIQICENCKHVNFFRQKKLGSFLIQNASVLPLAVKIKNDTRNFIYLYGFLIILFLIIFVIWNRYRIKSNFNQYITYPLQEIAIRLQENNSRPKKNHLADIKGPIKKKYIKEIDYLAREIDEYKKHKVDIELGKNLAQVAHDMRSPLLAVDSFFCLVEKKLDESERVFGRRAIRRLDDIVWSLLSKYKSKNENDSVEDSYVFLHSCIQELLSEKRMEYTKSNVVFEFKADLNKVFSLVYLSSVNLKRMLSNLINNAVNAIVPKSGIVEVSLETNIAGALISIKDNGRGMTSAFVKEILSNAKSNKIKTNLGLPHAIRFLEQTAGSFDITSNVGEGTTLFISFPPCKVPSWCLDEYQIHGDEWLIIVDDSKSVHDVWDTIFKKLHHVKYKHFYNPKEALIFFETVTDNKLVIFCDYEFFDEDQNGLDILERAPLDALKVLVTSHLYNPSIMNSTIRKGFKILPKDLVPYFRLCNKEQHDAQKQISLIFIDDEPRNTQSWEFFAEAKNLTIVTYNDIKAFFTNAVHYKKDIPIYVDLDLCEEKSGIAYAKEIFMN